MLPLLLLAVSFLHTAQSLYVAGPADPDDDHFYHFSTRPDIGAPKWSIETYDKDALAPGYWFVAPYAHLGQTDYPLWNGPHIYDQEGGLIWSGSPLFKHFNSYDFRVAQVRDELMLTAIVPHDLPGQPQPGFPSTDEGFILNSNYDVYDTVDMRGDSLRPNMHDLTVFNNGSRALMITQKTYDQSVLRIGNFNRPCNLGWQGFREIDLETGEVLFEWDAEGHIDPLDSTKRTGTFREMCQDEWDLLHLNAIDKFDDGDYLLSARHMDTIYKISHKNSSIIWQLGGLKNDFEFPDPTVRFTRQHHARFRGQNDTHTLVSLFNNAASNDGFEGDKPSSPESSGLLLALRTDVMPMTVSVVNRFPHPNGNLVQSRGSLSFLENGNAFVGWVRQSLISEHSFDGRLLMKASLRPGENSYRSYKFPWIGKPSEPPDVISTALKTGTGMGENQTRLTTQVHISWNGATEVASWELLHTNVVGNAFESVAIAKRQGFETMLSYDGFAEHVIAVALDRDGEEIGRSRTVQTTFPSDTLDVSIAAEAKWQHSHSSSIEASGSTQLEPPAPSDVRESFDRAISFKYITLAFGLGFTCCLVIGIAIWLLRRAELFRTGKSFWTRTSLPAYEPLPENEDEDLEQMDHALDEKPTA